MRAPVVALPLAILSITLPAQAEPSHAAIESDLNLTLTCDGPTEIDHWATLPLTLTLTNTSATDAHPVVLPGDGSWVGWREPAMGFQWQAWDTDTQTWTPLPPHTIGRCGVYDPDWRDEVVTLQPGDSTDVAAWSPGVRPSLAGHTRVRVRATYTYDARKPTTEFQPPPDPDHPRDPVTLLPFGAMRDTPPFSLQSQWIELTIHPPLTLALSQTKPLPRRGSFDPLEHFRVTLTNTTGRPFALFTPRARKDPGLVATVDLTIGRGWSMQAHYALRPVDHTQPLTIEPGRTIVLTDLPEPDQVRTANRITLSPEALAPEGPGANSTCTIVFRQTDWCPSESLERAVEIAWEPATDHD